MREREWESETKVRNGMRVADVHQSGVHIQIYIYIYINLTYARAQELVIRIQNILHTYTYTYTYTHVRSRETRTMELYAAKMILFLIKESFRLGRRDDI